MLSFLKYESIPVSGWHEAVFDSMQSYIRSHNLHPNDLVVLSSQISLVRQINQFWIEKEKTHFMFESYEELSVCTNKCIGELKNLDERELNILVNQNIADIERVRRTKKNHFYSNSGLIKLSTIHSYKGLESKTVFYIMGEKDDAEVVYTSITRSSENLVVFDVGSKNICSEFLVQHIK
jgi:ATP-dependent exoDNAse (exonuclease V) beta subunit